MSRTTLREATRALVGEGLLEVRRGAHGGIRVASRQQTSPSKLRALLRLSADEVEDSLDLRVALESGAARLAAERAGAEHLEALQRTFDRMESIFHEGRTDAVGDFWLADSEFHAAVAAAARSRRLLEAVEDARVEFLKPFGHLFDTIHSSAHDGHREILDALKARDPDRAARAAQEHVETTRRAVRALAGEPEPDAGRP